MQDSVEIAIGDSLYTVPVEHWYSDEESSEIDFGRFVTVDRAGIPDVITYHTFIVDYAMCHMLTISQAQAKFEMAALNMLVESAGYELDYERERAFADAFVDASEFAS